MKYYYSPTPNYQKGAHGNHHMSGKSMLRVEHNVAGAPCVDVYANGQLIVQNLCYTQFRGYVRVDPGVYKVQLTRAGERDVFFERDVGVKANRYYTVIVHGDINQPQSLGALKLQDMNTCPQPGKAHVRFVHATPSAPAVDVLANGQAIFRNVSYGNTGRPVYLPVSQGTYTLSVNLAGTNTTALSVPKVQLKDRGIYTIIAAGVPGDRETPLTAVVIPEPECSTVHN